MYTPQQIDSITFGKAMFGGYDMQSVDEFLEPLTRDYVALYKENSQLKGKMQILVDKLEEYRKNEEQTQQTMADAQAAADRMMKEAEAKCAKMLADAKAAAEEAAKKAAAEEATQKAPPASASDSETVARIRRETALKLAEIQKQLNTCMEALDQMRKENTPGGDLVLTDRASVDRPWMRFYPKEVSQMEVPPMTLNDFLKATCRGMDLPVIHYYGTEITWKRLFDMVDRAARALRAAGIGEGSQIPVLLRAVPEFLVLLLAAEKVGASLLCRDNTIEENAEALKKSGAKIMFTHDFITQEEMDAYCAAGIEEVVLIDPWEQAVESEMPDYIVDNLNALYPERRAEGEALESWNSFLSAGRRYRGTVEAKADINRPLYRCYTSGSTGTSKQVIHSAYSMLGVICQMTGYGASDDFRPTWLVTILPPALVAVTVSMLLVPMASNRLLILDPFVDVMDIDLELMRYKPNTWPLIPMFMEILMRSKRIPADYDMSHLLTCGAGAEASNNGQIRRAQKFLEDHNCHVVFSTSYGQSEAASNITFPAPGVPFGNGNVGIPMPLNVMGVFRGIKECAYNTLGEICVTGPGIMLGYDNAEATEKALIRHDDGMLWLHTGDTGYVTEEGVFYTLGRGLTKRWNEDPLKQNRLVDIQMENLIADADIPGVLDCFFVTRPDKEHEGFFVPYMYVVLEDGVTPEDVLPHAQKALNPHQYPVEIISIPERPFYHFKTNRLHMEAPYAR